MSESTTTQTKAPLDAEIMRILGLVVAAVALVGTALVTTKVINLENDPSAGDAERAALAITKWQPVLIGLSAFALGLILFGIGALLAAFHTQGIEVVLQDEDDEAEK